MFFCHSKRKALLIWAGCWLGCLHLSWAQNAGQGGNLVANSDFREAGPEGLPAHWQAWNPSWELAACRATPAPGGLLVKSASEPFAVGGVKQNVAGVQAGQAYRLQAEAQLTAIVWPLRSVLVRLNWTKASELLTPHGWLARGPVLQGSEALFDDVLVAPAGADGAQVQLEVKWPQSGQVLWKSVRLTACPAPPPRKARLGALYLKPDRSTVEQNLDLWCQKIDEAGQLKLDALCLGESILTVGTGKSLKEVAEPIPGPTTQRLAAAAKKNKLWVVAGLTEVEGARLYNTAILLDRNGALAGKYRKIHLPREEWQQGVTPGFAYPVFPTDFGPVAIQICYDYFYPEAAQAFAHNGARVLFAPTWGTTFLDQDGKAEGQTIFRVRARDNGIFMVASVYDGASLVIDPLGRLLSSKNTAGEIAWAEVDLDSREPLPWVGQWRAIAPRDRMPETYPVK